MNIRNKVVKEDVTNSTLTIEDKNEMDSCAAVV